MFLMSAKLANPGLHKIKIFQNKCYEIIVVGYDMTNKILSHDSDYIVDVAMWPKFGNSEVIISSLL